MRLVAQGDSERDQRIIEMKKAMGRYGVSITHKGLTSTEVFNSVKHAQAYLQQLVRKYELGGFTVRISGR
jgi:hypothetical protein